jgi:nitrite reductase/ring-hydroxylating ferredoxin subunit/Fe-S cluster biogenesis protein NfuA
MNELTPPADNLDKLLGNLQRLEISFAGWEEGHRGDVEAYRRAIDALHSEALRRIIRVLRGDAAASAALKKAAADPLVYAVLRHHELVKPGLDERVEAALATVRPMLAAHGGDVRLVKVAPPVVELEMIGACGGCASSKLTLDAGITKAVQDACPEIRQVISVKGLSGQAEVRFVSPFAFETAGRWLPACALEEIPENGVFAARIDGHDMVLSRRGQAVSCFENACAHLGLSIHDGKIENGAITCPHHGFRYDLATGECLTAPEVQLQSHAVRVIDGRVEIARAG